MTSILNDIKHALGLLPDDTAFDSDVILHINGALAILHQLGVGPEEGFMILGEGEQWTELANDSRLNTVKIFVLLKTKIAFDPPNNSFVLASMERQLEQLEFRITVAAE